MSTALLDDKLLPEAEFQRFLASHPEVMDDVEKPKTISHAFDLPYGAGYSLTGNRIYIDRHVPLIWPMKCLRHKTRRFMKVHIVKYPARHEAFESACIRLLAMDYETAHHHAVRAEWTLVEADGFGWDFYEKQWTPLIKADETELIERVPPDLDLTPYVDTPLHALLSARMVTTKKGAKGKFLRKA